MTGAGRLDGAGQLSSIGDTYAKTATVFGVECLDEARVVPVLDVVVGAFMNIDLDRVSVVVNQKGNNIADSSIMLS